MIKCEGRAIQALLMSCKLQLHMHIQMGDARLNSTHTILALLYNIFYTQIFTSNGLMTGNVMFAAQFLTFPHTHILHTMRYSIVSVYHIQLIPRNPMISTCSCLLIVVTVYICVWYRETSQVWTPTIQSWHSQEFLFIIVAVPLKNFS